ncbi:hypothetical protein HYN69_18200 (plasmid) [Gemmobacter aquarius]|uniref:Uncharacterized protein n=1 Tax=Paragemmobacter aquarius TaxID=2169400 RepID=A0A2S0URV6_9RHOB|nr:hypothetical protein HYN69_18200 [Gemmobacter aquarius]
MSDKIKLVEMARKAKPNAARQQRAKLIEQLQEQLKMAKTMLNDAVYERTKSTWARPRAGRNAKIFLQRSDPWHRHQF